MVSVMQGERNWRFFVKRNILSTTQWYCQADKAWLIVGLLADCCVCVCVHTSTCIFTSFMWRCGVAVGVGLVIVVGAVVEVRVFQISWNQKTTDSLSAYSSQCNVCGQWADISALCVCVRACRCVWIASCCSHGCVLLISHLCGQ